MIKIKRESAVSIARDGAELFKAHYAELEAHKSKAELAINFERFLAAEKIGALYCLGVRKDGHLIGYSIFSLYHPPEYATSVFANSEDMYLMPNERKGHLGLNLVRLAEEDLKGFGVKKINYHVRPEKDFSPILRRGGYQIDAVKYSKYL